MRRTRRYTLVAGLALIGLANAVALGGAAYNRSGEADSMLRLTERELRPPHEWNGRKENSGLELKLQWRALLSDKSQAGSYSSASDGGGSAAWLDKSKMTSLGFDVAPAPERLDTDRRSAYERQLPRDVFVVLELDGSAYRMALERAVNAAKELAIKNERGDGKKDADEKIDRETHRSSRLFAVDAGLDLSALRRKFEDRSRYAIVRGQVRPTWLVQDIGAAGVITNLSAATINVPLETHSVFEGVAPSSYLTPKGGGKRFEAIVAFGQRLEPWFVSAGTR